MSGFEQKRNTCEEVGHFAKMCRNKNQSRSGKSEQHNIFCEEEGMSGPISSELRTLENVFFVSATREYISVKEHKLKVKLDTGADSTLISSFIWTELGKSQLDGKIRRLEAYDCHQLTLLVSLTFDVEWTGSR